MEELTMEEKEQKINQIMRDEPDTAINAMAAMGMLEALSKKVAECKELVEQYKRTYPEIMRGGVTVVMAVGLFSMTPGEIEGVLPVEFVEGYRGAAKNLINKLKADVEA